MDERNPKESTYNYGLTSEEFTLIDDAQLSWIAIIANQLATYIILHNEKNYDVNIAFTHPFC